MNEFYGGWTKRVNRKRAQNYRVKKQTHGSLLFKLAVDKLKFFLHMFSPLPFWEYLHISPCLYLPMSV